MPTILPFDDLEPGKIIAIHSIHSAVPPVRRRRLSSFEDLEHDLGLHTGVPPRPTPPPGVPLEILAVNAPFVMVMALRPGDQKVGPIYLDSRCMRLMAVPSQMVEALRSLGLKSSAESGVAGDGDIPF